MDIRGLWVTVFVSLLCITGVGWLTAPSKGTSITDRFDVLLLTPPPSAIDEFYLPPEILVAPTQQTLSSPTNLNKFGSEVWLTGNLPAGSADKVLQISGQLLTRVNIWFINDHGNIDHQRAGNQYPFSERQIQSPGVSFKTPDWLDEKTRVFIHFSNKSGQPINFSSYLWTLSDWYDAEQLQHTWYGIFFGGFLILILYNAFLGVALRDSSYSYYIAYMTSLSLSVLFCSGLAEKYLWPDNAAPEIVPTLSAVGSAFALIFIRQFSRQALIETRLSNILRFLIVTFIAIAALYTLSLFTVSALTSKLVPAAHGTTLISALAFIFTATFLTGRGLVQARFLVVSMGWLLFCLLTYFTYTYGLLAHSMFIERFLEYGALGEGILLSLALADRISVLTQQKSKQQRDANYLEMSAARALVKGHESEKHRISALLHDSIGHELILLKQAIAAAKDPTLADTLLQRVDGISTQLRDISHDLHSELNAKLPLHLNIAATVDRAFEASGKDIQLHVDVIPSPLPGEVSITFVRILQESISNIIKHAEASAVTVELSASSDQIELLIEDNGKGFSPDSIQSSQSVGLLEMRSRTKLIGAMLNIQSKLGNGTKLTLTYPVSERRNTARPRLVREIFTNAKRD